MDKSFLFFIFVAFFVASLQAMNDAMTVDNKRIVWTVVLEHGRRWFSHDMICSLAVSKRHDEILRKTAQERKNYLIELMSPKLELSKSCRLVLEANCWHKYGTACGRVDHHFFDVNNIVVDSRSVKKILALHWWHLADKGEVKYAHASWNNFYGYLPQAPRGFFNDKSDFCFHGYGDQIHWKGDIPHTLSSQQVIEYSLSPNGSKKAFCCTMDMNITRGLNLLLNFPPLLKAFLKSSKVAERGITIMESSVQVKLFFIDGVIIPENYEEYESYCSEALYAEFADLPIDVKQDIVMRKKAHKK